MMSLDDLSLSQGITSELVRFDDFYDISSSLNNNRDGDLTADLITNQGIADWISMEYPDTTGGQELTWIPDWLCITTVRCVIAKCPAGGIYNPICDGCAAVAVACVVERVIGMF
jgi:hypothetical protein